MCRWKNYENRSIFSKDMDKSIVSPFFDSRCIFRPGSERSWGRKVVTRKEWSWQSDCFVQAFYIHKHSQLPGCRRAEWSKRPPASCSHRKSAADKRRQSAPDREARRAECSSSRSVVDSWCSTAKMGVSHSTGAEAATTRALPAPDAQRWFSVLRRDHRAAPLKRFHFHKSDCIPPDETATGRETADRRFKRSNPPMVQQRKKAP